MLVTVKGEETISIIRNIVVPFIKVEYCKDENIHAFKIINIYWVPKNTVLRRPKILEVVKMTANYFLKHEIPFQFDPDIGMFEQVNLIKLKYAD